LLILISVVIGARLVAASDHSEPVWVATHDLAAGTEVTSADLTKSKVHLDGDGGRYVTAKVPVPAGYVLTRPVGRGELLPVAALARPGDVSAYRLVTVQVAPLHLPPHLATGDRVDLWVTPRAVGNQSAPARLVYDGAVVQAVNAESHGLTAATADTAVVLHVPPRAVSALIAAIHGGDVDLVLVPPGQA
jgi:Flp pilus assembly protein CpaB